MVTEQHVIAALFRHFHPVQGDINRWACFDHLRMGTGFGPHAERIIDFFALNCEPSSGFQSFAIEVKVSRSDFRRELANPAKRLAASVIARRFAFAYPRGLIEPNEVPVECGIFEYADGVVEKRRQGLETGLGGLVVPSWQFVASLLRRQSVDEWRRRAGVLPAAVEQTDLINE